VSSIVQDKAGNLWLTSLGGGAVTRYGGNDVTWFTVAQDFIRNFNMAMANGQE